MKRKIWPRLILTKEDRHLRSLIDSLQAECDAYVRLIAKREFVQMCEPECVRELADVWSRITKIPEPLDYFGFNYLYKNNEAYFLSSTLIDEQGWYKVRNCPSESVLQSLNRMQEIDQRIQQAVHEFRGQK